MGFVKLGWVLACLFPGVVLGARFTLSSPQIRAGGTIPLQQVYRGYGCNGGNRSPALTWQGAPRDTRSFALTVFDPDAPTGTGWWHWLVVNLPARTHGVPAGAGSPSGIGLPQGAQQIRNDFGVRAYGGPCPPVGDRPHRYRFTLYALDTPNLQLPFDTGPARTGAMIRAHAIAKTGFVAYYGR